MGFSRQEYWSGLLFPTPGDLLDPGIELVSPALEADSLPYIPPGEPKNSGVGSLSLLQVIFPTQVIKLGSPVLQVDSLPAELLARWNVSRKTGTCSRIHNVYLIHAHSVSFFVS